MKNEKHKLTYVIRGLEEIQRGRGQEIRRLGLHRSVGISGVGADGRWRRRAIRFVRVGAIGRSQSLHGSKPTVPGLRAKRERGRSARARRESTEKPQSAWIVAKTGLSERSEDPTAEKAVETEMVFRWIRWGEDGLYPPAQKNWKVPEYICMLGLGVSWFLKEKQGTTILALSEA